MISWIVVLDLCIVFRIGHIHVVWNDENTQGLYLGMKKDNFSYDEMNSVTV